MKNFTILTVWLPAVLASFACGKKDPQPSGKVAMKSPVCTSISSGQTPINRETIQIIDADHGGALYGHSGARFIFPPRSFYWADGKPVEGLVKVEVSESIAAPNKMLVSTLNLRNGSVLFPGAFFSLKASQGNKEVLATSCVRYQANWAMYSLNISHRRKAL